MFEQQVADALAELHVEVGLARHEQALHAAVVGQRRKEEQPVRALDVADRLALHLAARVQGQAVAGARAMVEHRRVRVAAARSR